MKMLIVIAVVFVAGFTSGYWFQRPRITQFTVPHITDNLGSLIAFQGMHPTGRLMYTVRENGNLWVLYVGDGMTDPWLAGAR